MKWYKYIITVVCLLFGCSSTSELDIFKYKILKQCKLDIDSWVINPDSVASQLDSLNPDKRHEIDSLQNVFTETQNYSAIKKINYILSHSNNCEELQKHYLVEALNCATTRDEIIEPILRYAIRQTPADCYKIGKICYKHCLDLNDTLSIIALQRIVVGIKDKYRQDIPKKKEEEIVYYSSIGANLTHNLFGCTREYIYFAEECAESAYNIKSKYADKYADDLIAAISDNNYQYKSLVIFPSILYKTNPIYQRYCSCIKQGDYEYAQKILQIIIPEDVKKMFINGYSYSISSRYNDENIYKLLEPNFYFEFEIMCIYEQARLSYLRKDLLSFDKCLDLLYAYGIEKLFPTNGYFDIKTLVSPYYAYNENIVSLLSLQYLNSDIAKQYNSALFLKASSGIVSTRLIEGLKSKEAKIAVDSLQFYEKLRRDKTISLYDTSSYNLEKEWVNIVKNEIGESMGRLLNECLLTYTDVALALSNNNCAIEFIETPSFEDQESKYLALILRADWQEPQRVYLCNKEDIIELISIRPEHSYWRHDHSKQQELTQKYYKKGYELIWAKLEPYINEGDDVYFSPAGLLHQMNIEVTQDENGRLANEKYNLHRVSSTRELCTVRPEIERTSAVLYGGLEYDMDSETMLAQSRAYSRTDDYLATRGFDADSTQRGDLKLLPNSKTEIAAICEYLRQHGIDYTSYTAQAGTEESFKALSGKKTPIIHLATHGFFYTNEEAQQKTYFERLNADPRQSRPDNSLKRSGLILAGAQLAWDGKPIPDSVEDGILLAEEIATMDLSGTDLVVLSACQTGLGEITSEGVFGLQRAFKKAGVQTLIMSLWKVDDHATQLMMTTFYDALLAGKSKHEAFAIAQSAVRNTKGYENPYYWASFIMLD